jgi:peptide chain release factor subunit 1
MAAPAQTNQTLERFLLKRRLKELQAHEGTSTSMVTIYVRGNYPLSLISQMLKDESSKCTNIKDRVNRQSVEDALTSAAVRLRQETMHKSPATGLCLFAGSVMLADGRTKRITYLLTPPREVGTFYKCDKQFHVQELLDQLEDERVFGFLVVDGNGALYGTLSGTAKNTLFTFEVDLPKKHGRGGQSALRFSRLREEARHNYERFVCDYAMKYFWDPIAEKPKIVGLIMAGSAEFKQTISESALLDARLKALLVGVLDIQYGFEAGFNEAISQAGPVLSGLKLTEEARLLSHWMSDLNQGSLKVIFGLRETLAAYEAGVVTELLVWDGLVESRYVVTGNSTRIVYAREQPLLERGECVTEEIPLLDWLIEQPRKGVTLHLISDATSQGSQFVKGFGGVGGFLQYAWQPEEPEEVAAPAGGPLADDDFGL